MRANRSPGPASGLSVASLARVSRPPRIEIANGSFHVVGRGNEREPIYRDAGDWEPSSRPRRRRRANESSWN